MSVRLSVTMCIAKVESCAVVFLRGHDVLFSSAVGFYCVATTHSENLNSRNFRVWNNHTIPVGKFRRFCSAAIPQATSYAVRSALLATARLLVLNPYARQQERSPPLTAQCWNYIPWFGLSKLNPPFLKKRSINCTTATETVNGYNPSTVKNSRRMFAPNGDRAI